MQKINARDVIRGRLLFVVSGSSDGTSLVTLRHPFEFD